MKKIVALCLSVLWGTLAWADQDQTPASEAPGPWIFATIGVGKKADGSPETTALKGLAVKVGVYGEASVCYDLDLCRMAGAWTGGKFVTPMNLRSCGEYPTALGEPMFLSKEVGGFQLGHELKGESAGAEQFPAWRDPRSEPFGPLPGLRYEGIIISNNHINLRWRSGKTEITEEPGYETRDGCKIFTRDFLVPVHEFVIREPSEPKSVLPPLRIAVCRLPPSPDESLERQKLEGDQIGAQECVLWRTENRLMAASLRGPEGSTLKEVDGQLVAQIPAHENLVIVKLRVGTIPTKDSLPSFVGVPSGAKIVRTSSRAYFNHDLRESARWPNTLETKGEMAQSNDDAYVVDTVRIPDPNPWGVPMFISGFDFFPDGRAAVCTFHGDVFIVSGLDATLEHVKWKRFATGLYQPLGLKVVNGEIYVAGRDGLTRLRDSSGRGEADSYEVFNWDIKVTKNFHEFVFDLQTDPAGNFYFAKGGPVKSDGRGFDQICDHHGCLFRVTPDGKALTVMATGFLMPNGIGIGPNLEITSGDNAGTWAPACRINWINQGGFYGTVPLAHWPEVPHEYEKPICWLPKRVDNSSGSQLWVTSDKWGPWHGRMLHLSHGQCALFGVMMEGVDSPDAPDCCSHLMQGGVVKFPLQFQSGIMRARFHPVDGQLYVAGMRGWETTALKNGCLQRVRYTGAPVRMPIELEVKKTGISVRFSCSLDAQKAADPENWKVEVWNYIWSAASGSPEISTLGADEKPGERGKDGEAETTPARTQRPHHDPLEVKSATVGADGRTVFLEIPELKPVMQMSIQYQLRSADGKDLAGEIVNTINALPTE